MSQFSNLAALATRVGEGKAFLQKQERERALVGNVLRQRQQAAQAKGAEADREVRLRELAAKNESNRFSQAIAVQAEQRKQVQATAAQEISARKTAVSNALQERQLSKMESDLGIAQQKADTAQGTLEVAQQREQRLSRQIPDKAINKRSSEILGDLRKMEQLLDPVTSNLSDDDRVQLEQARGQLLEEHAGLQRETETRQGEAIQRAEQQQKERAVTRKEAGPTLAFELQTAGQTRVLEAPLNPDTSRIDGKKLKPGTIYQTSKGPAIWSGSTRGFRLIREVE